MYEFHHILLRLLHLLPEMERMQPNEIWYWIFIEELTGLPIRRNLNGALLICSLFSCERPQVHLKMQSRSFKFWGKSKRSFDAL